MDQTKEMVTDLLHAEMVSNIKFLDVDANRTSSIYTTASKTVPPPGPGAQKGRSPLDPFYRGTIKAFAQKASLPGSGTAAQQDSEKSQSGH